MTDEQARWIVKRLGATCPIVSLDVESCQTFEGGKPDPTSDRIVQFGAVKVHPDGTVKRFVTLVNPMVPINPSSTAVHGITDAMVAGQGTWRDVGPGIIKGLQDCILVGYNVARYDMEILRAECHRHRIFGPGENSERKILDGWQVASHFERRDLAWAVERYAGRKQEGGHQADVDAEDALDVMIGQLKEYDLPATVEQIDQVVNAKMPHWVDDRGVLVWSGDAIVITITDQAGTAVEHLDQGLVDWFLRKSFSDVVKNTIRAIRRGNYPKREGVNRGSETTE